MEVLHRQQPLEARIDPRRALGRLALGTVPVAARIVGDADEPAAVARVDVPAQDGRPALDQVRHHSGLFR